MGAPLYDTRVLIEHIRDRVIKLDDFTAILNLMEFPKAITLKGFNIIIPGKDDYDKRFEKSILLLKAGTPIPAVDIVLSAIAANSGLVLHTRDRHFEYVRKINREFQGRIE